MQFDVIIGNPPYQMTGGAGGTSDAPIYQLFVEQALKLEPRYAVFVIPSRWMAGGRGWTSSGSAMLAEQAPAEPWSTTRSCRRRSPGSRFEGGVCYFLWDRDHQRRL